MRCICTSGVKVWHASILGLLSAVAPHIAAPNGMAICRFLSQLTEHWFPVCLGLYLLGVRNHLLPLRHCLVG